MGVTSTELDGLPVISQEVVAAMHDIRFDVIIDDGCHTNLCIWKSFKSLFLESTDVLGVVLIVSEFC